MKSDTRPRRAGDLRRAFDALLHEPSGEADHPIRHERSPTQRGRPTV